MLSYLHALSLLLAFQIAYSLRTIEDACNEEQVQQHPLFCGMMDRLIQDPDQVAAEMKEWALSRRLLADVVEFSSTAEVATLKGRRLGQHASSPVVLAHGMGDSCFNSGMQRIVSHTAEKLGGVYATCIATGKTQTEDTTNGYFLNMNANVDLFAEGVRADPKLAHGFHAIGHSQGNNVIRGYIQKYNDPPVNTFISINGPIVGIGAVPYCRPKTSAANNKVDRRLTFDACELLQDAASNRAYTEYIQEHNFQANYWRDPRPSEAEAYKQYAQLADWNNEGYVVNETLKENFGKTNKFVWVMAEQDEMVWPKEGEQWGAPDPNDPFNTIMPMKETEWYKNDLFGLRTAEEAGKNNYESFEGDHLQYTMEQYDGWLEKYLT